MEYIRTSYNRDTLIQPNLNKVPQAVVNQGTNTTGQAPKMFDMNSQTSDNMVSQFRDIPYNEGYVSRREINTHQQTRVTRRVVSVKRYKIVDGQKILISEEDVSQYNDNKDSYSSAGQYYPTITNIRERGGITEKLQSGIEADRALKSVPGNGPARGVEYFPANNRQIRQVSAEDFLSLCEEIKSRIDNMIQKEKSRSASGSRVQSTSPSPIPPSTASYVYGRHLHPQDYSPPNHREKKRVVSPPSSGLRMDYEDV